MADNGEAITSGAPGTGLLIATGVGLMLLLFIGGLGWAGSVTLESGTLAPGKVVVEGQRRTVQHLEGGIIERIHVAEGEAISRGEVLVTLESVRSRAKLDQVRGALLSELAARDRLIAEQKGWEAIDFTDELAEVAPSAEALRDVKETQRDIFDARRKFLAGQERIAERRIAQLREEVTGLEAQIRSQFSQLALIADEVGGLERLLEKGFARRPRLLALQREAEDIRGAQAQNRAAVARAREKIGEIELSVLEDRTRIVNEASEKLQSTRRRIAELREESRSLGDILSRTEIRAPTDGVALDVQVSTVGGVIEPGQKILDIVPDDARLLIEARVTPTDIDSVFVDLPALVQLSAFRLDEAPALDGRVTTVSADSLTDPATGAVYYSALIEILDEEGVASLPGPIYPGMPAEVLIVTGARTPLSYIVEPVRRVLDRGLRES